MTAHKQIDALMAGEQLHLAKTCIAEALERTEPELLDQVERWRLSLRQVRLALMLGDEPTDELIFTVEDLLCEPCAAEARVAAELPLAHALRIRCFARKRCQELAREAVKAAHEALGEHPELLVAEGSSALEFDERQTARARYQRALELDPQHEAARLAMANLCYVEGDFAGARQQLERFEENTAGLHWGCAVRLRASVYAVQQDHQAEAAQWRRLVQQLPEGDSATSDRLALALALAAGGQREQALEQFRAAWRDDPDTPEGRYARERMEFLQGASPQTACKRLPAFPTTRQRWNYCGPAVLELCLKYLEIDLQQEEIAREVKRTTGTPMYEIVHYLRQRCVVARRIEATPQRLKAAIDLGLPVIVQEEYSTTSHVAVITGYDESLGMFIANDPMTHRQALRSFKWTERAGELFGNGGVIVLGRDGEQLQPLLARADEAGLVEARHLTLLDECDRRRPKPGSGEVEDATLQQVCELCLEALKLALADADRYSVDPDFNDIPLESLLSKTYAGQRRSLIDTNKAGPEMEAGVPSSAGDTVYLAVTDGEGNSVSFINSTYLPFGSGVVVEGTGICLQNRGSMFSLEADHPNCIQPHKRPYHTLMPALVLKDSSLFLTFGVMGGIMQPQGHIQVLLNIIDFNMEAQTALDASRFFYVPEGGRVPYIPESGCAVEPGISPDVRRALENKGHHVFERGAPYFGIFGGAQAIMVDPQSKALIAGSDHRKDGCAIGVY